MNNSLKHFIIDEWIWHDISGENGEKKRKETFKFIKSLYEKCDKIVTMQSSKFESKFYKLCEESNCNIIKFIIKYYKSCIFYNSKKYIAISKEEYQFNDIPIKDDDRYLIIIYNKLQGLIITTDNLLLENLKKLQIQSEHRDKFLLNYIN